MVAIANEVYCSILTHTVVLKLLKKPPENPPEPVKNLSNTTKLINFQGQVTGASMLLANDSNDVWLFFGVLASSSTINFEYIGSKRLVILVKISKEIQKSAINCKPKLFLGHKNPAIILTFLKKPFHVLLFFVVDY